MTSPWSAFFCCYILRSNLSRNDKLLTILSCLREISTFFSLLIGLHVYLSLSTESPSLSLVTGRNSLNSGQSAELFEGMQILPVTKNQTCKSKYMVCATELRVSSEPTGLSSPLSVTARTSH